MAATFVTTYKGSKLTIIKEKKKKRKGKKKIKI